MMMVSMTIPKLMMELWSWWPAGREIAVVPMAVVVMANVLVVTVPVID